MELYVAVSAILANFGVVLLAVGQIVVLRRLARAEQDIKDLI